MEQRKAVEIYLRVKGPKDPTMQPEFKIMSNDTKIRFKDRGQREEEQIAAQFVGEGIFKFQKIYRQQAEQEEIFNRVARDIVQSALEGYNGTIFAYGQTGSGKTYTMTGGDHELDAMGIIPRAIDYLYREAEVREEDVSIKLRYMQIYKRGGYDLLHPDAKKVKKLEDLPQVKPIMKGGSFDFQNLSELDAPNFEEAMKIFQYGETNRIVCKTPNNDQSSRSHCILMLIVKTKNRETGLQQRAIINLVDLAGSERIHNSGMDQKLATEGININLGLHFLSRVIIALGNKVNNDFIPYRDSLLTMALKSSLGGNCKTRMIATINPNPRNTPENVATCRFSQNLLAMENKVKKNQFIDPWVIIKSLKKEVEELRAEIGLLRGDGEVKEFLQRNQIVEIRKKVDEFLEFDDAKVNLPLTDRLNINEYLNYMKSIIVAQRKGKKVPDLAAVNAQNFCDGHVTEIKKLRGMVQQKQNEINLLLSIINDKKSSNNYGQMEEEDEGKYLALQDVSEKKIAQTVVNSLLKDARRKPINISVEEVEKHLIKPIQLNEGQDIENAFKKFKDSHMKTETIEEADSQIKLKEMKKEVLVKKLKNMKHGRARLNEKIEEEQKFMQRKNIENLPSLMNQTKENDLSLMKQQLLNMDEHIRKKYKELKTLELEISRLGLGKNKDNERVKVEFDSYYGHHSSRKNSCCESDCSSQRGRENDRENEESEQSFCIQNEVQKQLNSFMLAKCELRGGIK